VVCETGIWAAPHRGQPVLYRQRLHASLGVVAGRALAESGKEGMGGCARAWGGGCKGGEVSGVAREQAAVWLVTRRQRQGGGWAAGMIQEVKKTGKDRWAGQGVAS
jgi:hypothetical protein